MHNAQDLINTIKQISNEAMEASQPSDFYFGKVISTSPLKIMIDQKLILGSAHLVLTRNVTDYKVNVSVDWNTDTKSGGSGDSSFASHYHDIKGKKSMTIHNALVVGDNVILVKKKGGQKYLVYDRMVTQ